MGDLEFTPVVPTLAGIPFAIVATGDGNDTFDQIPISASMRTVVVIQNIDSSPHTVTFTSQADEWGNTGASLDKTITVGANKTYITGVWLRNRWGEKDVPTAGEYTCTVSYDNINYINMTVINVPSVDKN